MKPVRMWAVMREGFVEDEVFDVHETETEAEEMRRTLIAMFGDFYSIRRCTVTLEEKEKGE